MKSLAHSLSGEILGSPLCCEGGGLDVSRGSLPHSLALLWGVEISEHPNVRLRAEEFVLERSQSEIVVLIVQIRTFIPNISPPRQLLSCTEEEISTLNQVMLHFTRGDIFP